MDVFACGLKRLLAMAIVACTQAPDAAAPPQAASPAAAVQQPAPPAIPWKAVLIAGDASVAVFDNAADALQSRLQARGVAAGDIDRLSASRDVIAQQDARLARLDVVEGVVRRMQPDAGQACLVYATSLAARGRGLYLAPSNGYLTPAALDRDLSAGCGDAPTVAVISGCFTGSFTEPPMARPNRIILTAARADRSTFGCTANRDFTVYDQCLLDAFDHAPTWQAAHERIVACVARSESAMKVQPSLPQAYLGEDVAALALPQER